MKQKLTSKRLFILSPVLGVSLFIALYFVAAWLYPGGSPVDAGSPGFSWSNNYWCNLLNKQAINGAENPARPVAIIAMFVLAATMMIFWLLIFFQAASGHALRKVLFSSAILCMLFVSQLAFAGNHDVVVNLASLFGLTATICTMVVLYRKRWKIALVWGCVNIILVAINNYFYYTSALIGYLPIVQKITFVSFLLWICWVDLVIYRQSFQRV